MKTSAYTRHRQIWAVLILMAGFVFSPARGDEDVPAVNAQDIKALVNDFKGKVVVVNFWATWCPPCVKEFPDLIKLHEQYKDRGLEVIAVSMNEADEMEDIQAFLEKYRPPFSIYRSVSTEESFYQEFDEGWWGQMPTTMIYDTSGKRVHLHMKPVTYTDLEQDITAILPAPM